MPVLIEELELAPDEVGAVRIGGDGTRMAAGGSRPVRVRTRRSAHLISPSYRHAIE